MITNHKWRLVLVFVISLSVVFCLSLFLKSSSFLHNVFASSDGLVVAYGFNNPNNPYLNSAVSASNLNLTCTTNCPTYIANGGRDGSGAFDFALSGKYLTIPSENLFDFTKKMTVSFWMKNNVFDNSYESMVVKGGSAWGVTRNATSQGVAFGTLGQDGIWNFTAPAKVVADNVWRHIAVTYDGLNKKVYVNGVLETNQQYNKSILNNNSPVTIGYNPSFPSYDYTGLIDDVRIYNRAITASEVVEDMNTPIISVVSSPTPTLVPTASPTPVSTVLPTPTMVPTLVPSPTPTVLPTTTPVSTYPVQPGKQVAYTSILAGGRQYLLFLPDNYNTPPAGGFPLIMFTHGYGVLQGTTGVDGIRLEPLPGMLDSRPNFQYIVVSPRIYSQDLGGTSWLTNTAKTSLHTLLDEIQANYNVNVKKTYITGYSMGGAVTWNMAYTYPNKFAAVAPVAGYYQSYTQSVIPANVCDLFGKPVKVHHGTSDTTINVSLEQNLVNAINNCGDPDSAVGVYSNWNHDTINAAVFSANDNLYNWMSQYSLP